MLLQLLLWATLLCQICDGKAFPQRHKRTVWRHMRQIEPVKDPSPSFSLLAPAKIRPGTKQNILVEGHNLAQVVEVTVVVYDYPNSQTALSRGSVFLNSDNNYSVLQTLEINPNLLLPDGKKKYVKLVAQFSNIYRAEKVMAVSFRSGHIFIQTDKPIYNPGDKVRFRAFVSDLEFRSSERTISLEIQNPDGIAVHGIGRVKAIDGVFSDIFSLSTVVKEGRWKVVAKFDQGKENVFSREFEVKKYVLPAFNVTLTPKTSHLSLDAEKLEVEITARYLYGAQVKGVAYVLFGIEINGEKKRLTSMKQIDDLNGGSVSLTMEEIKRAYPDINSLLGSTLYVKASVLTSSGSDLVEAEKSGIKIVKSPYMLTIKDTPKYYKPGLPLAMTVIVSNHDGSPTPNIPVKVTFLESPISVHSGTINIHINMPKTHILYGNSQILKVETVDPSLKPEQQAIQEVYVKPYSTFSGHDNFLHVSVGASRVVVGGSVSVQMYIKSSLPNHRALVEHLTYIVLNKGKIIQAGRVNVKGQDVTSVHLLITTEMLPAFRFVAYYVLPWQHRAEVVADSVFVDVEDRCVGSLNVGPVDGEIVSSYSPGSSFKFQVKGDVGAKVSLVAVDNAIFLLSKNRLTQKKVWEVVDQADMGCTAGGGKDNMGVFSDAGLMFHSSTGGSTDSKEDCSSKTKRRRRSAAKLQLRDQLEKAYSDELLQRCCVDGMKEIPMPYSCYRRSLYITEDWSCVLAFLRCCAEYRGEELGVITRPPPTTAPPTIAPPTTSPPTLFLVPHLEYHFPEQPVFFVRDRVLQSMPKLHAEANVVGVRQDSYREVVVEEEEEAASVFEEDDLSDLEDIYVRSKFFESWLWTDIRLPSTAKSDGLAVFPVDTVLPDSITQWGFLAVSASPEKGVCVAEPYNVRVWKPFFIDLRLPHSVSRNEQVEIKAVIHNYKNSTLEVMVILEKTEDMCSVAYTGQHRQQVTVAAGSSKLITYTIIPLKTGELPLQVTAVAASFMGQDAVKKNLRVVVEGIQTLKVRSFVLNPSEKGGSAGQQLIQVKKMQLDAVVPKSVPETFVNVRGDLLADSIDNSIKEDSLAALIRMPGGCVEQNLARITLPLIAAHYLDRSADWEIVGISRREEAIKYIQRGYENQLNYKKSDDSYPPYANEGTSTWITAYVVKVFSMAHSFINVNEKHLCGPLLYLLKNKQGYDGTFQEDNPVYDTSMTGAMRGSEYKASLTAFVLIALAEAQDKVTCQDQEVNIRDKSRQAAGYLTEHFSRLTRPYTAAIACYALAVSNNACVKSMLLKFASPDHSHWPDSNNYFFTLEATGYALLALIKSGHMEEAEAPFRWLNEHRGIGGGYGSTQSTMVVLQALSEYLVKRPPPSDLNLLVQLSVPGRSDVRWTFNPNLAYVARSSRVPLDQEFSVAASGNGKGVLEVVTVYHQLPDVYENSTCNGFQLDVSIAETNEKTSSDVEKSFRLNVNVRALEERQVRMVILDIGLPTGFEPENSDLELLTNSVDRYINNFQVVDNLSDRGSLIIHLFKVSNKEAEMISFRLNQKFKVGLLQPSTVKVYQYYNKDKSCSRFYSPPEDKQQLDQICEGDVCRCSQGDCCVMKEDFAFFGKEQRNAAVCNGLHHGEYFFRVNYCCLLFLSMNNFSSAYRVKLISISQSHYYQYEMEIVQVIKEGTEEGLNEKERRMFLSHASCRTRLNLKEGQEYLVIGPITDVWNAGSTVSNKYVYTLGKETWVERWPDESECGSTLQKKCDELKSFAKKLIEDGCQA
ncbi:complement C3b.1 isoform X1 [Danio rerio]|uniref:Complement C3b.1 isoform X1 n=1 Tax=Danio rerio TaxID=7955 RepID=A0A8M3B5N7_DANRE|nr:complement component c3b, tandem duplicate 1 isoform X1 [Danio rerio]|eukprot:XP_009294664.1 complement component c3b, tandem duplicate 1 isoform X1 [Danio rerio]